MHLDISTMQIPDVSVVPEPTSEDIAIMWPIVLRDCETDKASYLCVCFSRRCRTLEAEVERLRKKYEDAMLMHGFTKEFLDG